MGFLAFILGILGGLSAVMGIITAAEVIPLLGAEFTWMFWFILAVILLVGTTACLVAQGRHE